MELYILNKDYEKIGFIDQAESILWNKKYNDLGECEIYVPCDSVYIELLKEGNIVYRTDDSMFCELVNFKIETDIESGDYIIATGRDMSNILSDRIVRWEIVYSGKAIDFLVKLISDNIIFSPQEYRRISNFSVNVINYDDFTETLNMSVFAGDLLDILKTICKTYNYGFRTKLDDNTKQIIFELYKGKNKASLTSNEYIEFSPTYANIISSDYEKDISNYKNVCYVGYKGEDEKLTLLSVYNTPNEPIGKNRKEIYIDGSGTSRDITLEELKAIYGTVQLNDNVYYSNDVAVAKINGDKITITDHTYLLLIRILGLNTLAEHNKTEKFTGDIDTIDTYEYKRDYDLGDIVCITNDYGISAEARIVEIMESNDTEDGYVVEPKFEYIE